VPEIEQALRDQEKHSRDGGRTFALPIDSLAITAMWVDKQIRFGVPTLPNFRVAATGLAEELKKEPAKVGPAEAAAAFRKHVEAIRKIDGVKDVLLDEARIVVVVQSEAPVRAKLGDAIDGVPLAYVVEK
jgi:hypothetical protein